MRIRVAAILLWIGLLGQGVTFGQAHFKRFPETVTNDGAYVLAWGLKDDEEGDVASKTEIPANGAEKIDIGEVEFSTFEDVEDYVVDTKAGKIVAVIPDFTYFAGSEGRENHFGIQAGWSPDDHGGIAIYEGRYSTDKVAWINPAEHKAVAIFPQIEKALRQAARQKKGRRAVEDEISVGSPVFLTPRRFLLNVTMGALSSKNEKAVYYRFDAIFNVKGDLKAQLELISAKWKGEDSNNDVGDEEIEAELNKLYQKLTKKLSPRDRESLKQDQLKWLATREHLSDDAQKNDKEFHQLEFTRRRVNELRMRVLYQ
jgi:hypothetical protein